MKISLQDALNEGAARLRSAGVTEARMEATSLMMHALGVDRAFVIAHPEHELTGEQSETFRDLVRRRAAREPLQHITGSQEFFKLKFEVTPDVLSPRPETELIVEAALEFLKREQPVSILDVGTGSGCIVISLLHELKRAHGVATDISARALLVAERNARSHNVNDRLTLIQTDSLSTLNSASGFSLIVSNPPYIPAGDIEKLQPEVREHEPLTALVSGADGLDHIRRLLRETPRLLHPAGYFIFEIGFGQMDSVAALIDPARWRLAEVRADLQGIPRALILQRI